MENDCQTLAYLRVLSESYPMNTDMKGLDCFQKSLRPCSFDVSSLSIWQALRLIVIC